MILPVPVTVILWTVFSLAADIRHDGINRQKLNYTNRMPVEYKPLRIHQVYLDDYFGLHCESTISYSINRAVQKIMQLLHVVPVQQKLLLKNSGCHKENRQGRCVSLKRNYEVQTCGETVTIPSSHLDGLYLWNETDPIKAVFAAGDGIPDADFVLYIESMTTDKCLGDHSVLSYTEVCQVDQFDRPIAGYINICPYQLCPQDPALLKEEELYKIMVHELFHLLGFSKNHFGYFKKCDIKDTELECQPLDSVRLKEIDRKICMVTPAVLRETQHVFGCHYNSKFCVQIDAKDYQYTSHWNQEFLPDSIMTPYLDKLNSTLIDRITLAVFEDSGWYKVDYSKTDQYNVDSGSCISNMKFCSDSDKVACTMNKRCLKEHKTKVSCLFKMARQCWMFNKNGKESCMKMMSPGYEEELYGKHSICFMSNITETPMDVSRTLEGRCYQYRCTDSRELMIKVKMSSWILCPYETLIQLPGYFGYMECPTQGDSFCQEISVTSTIALTSTKLFVPTSINIEYNKTSGEPKTNLSLSGGNNETISIFCFMITLLLCFKTI